MLAIVLRTSEALDAVTIYSAAQILVGALSGALVMQESLVIDGLEFGFYCGSVCIILLGLGLIAVKEMDWPVRLDDEELTGECIGDWCSRGGLLDDRQCACCTLRFRSQSTQGRGSHAVESTPLAASAQSQHSMKQPPAPPTAEVDAEKGAEKGGLLYGS